MGIARRRGHAEPEKTEFAQTLVLVLHPPLSNGVSPPLRLNSTNGCSPCPRQFGRSALKTPSLRFAWHSGERQQRTPHRHHLLQNLALPGLEIICAALALQRKGSASNRAALFGFKEVPAQSC